LAWAHAAGRSKQATNPSSGPSIMAPSPAPLPSSLPNRGVAESAVLYGTSCSSTAFCLAVGYVTSDRGDNFPLVETYDGVTWTPSVAPLPQGYGPPANGFLYSVSCPSDGTCAAVGDYLDPSGYQQALLEYLAGGAWSAGEGVRPTASAGGLMNLRSVSCGSSGSCVATGDLAYGDSYLALVYELSSGTWQIQPAPPLPGDYGTGLVLSSVSCAGAGDCVVVGSYDDTPSAGTSSSEGLILTLSSGNWSVQEAPLPAGADTQPDALGLQVLDAVDCPAPGTCVAGGGYVDTTGVGDPLFLTLQSGTWTPSEAPVPAGQVNEWAIVNSISCPAVGECVADGTELGTDGVEGGIMLTQSASGWSATTAPQPVTESSRTRGHSALGRAGRTRSVRRKTVFESVFCATTSFCRAVGSYDGRQALIERQMPPGNAERGPKHR